MPSHGSPQARHLALGLALLGAPSITLVALAPSTAHAQQAVFAGPVVDLVPGSEVVGDGSTPVTLNLVALNADGTAMTGLSGKISADSGRTDRLEEVGNGLYRVSWTPPRVASPAGIELSFRGRAPDKTPINVQWSARVVPPLNTQMRVAAAPNRLMLGQGISSTVTVSMTGSDGKGVDGADLVVRTVSGKVANVTSLGEGRFSALYSPPAKQYPHLELITIADRRDPASAYGAMALPLIGQASFPVVGIPNSRIILEIGDQEFGPVQADGAGRAQIPIVVQPGVSEATVVSIVGDKKTEEPLDLQVPATQRVALFPTQASIPADPMVTVPVRAFVATPVGGYDQNAKVSFSVTAGTISTAKHEGSGIYVADFTPPYGSSASQVTIQVSVADAKGTQADSLTVNLVPALAAMLTVTPEPEQLLANASGFKAFVRLVGSDGVGTPNRPLNFVASGATQQGPVKDLGNGDYQAAFSTSGSGPVELIVAPKSTASANPLHRIIAFPSSPRVANDGMSSTVITALTLDAFGFPVANVPLGLRIAQGDGSLPASVTTDASGMAHIPYTAGRVAGVVHIQIEGNEHLVGVGLLQAPAGVAPALTLPPSGSAPVLAIQHAWQSIVKSVRLERAGMVGAPVKVLSRAEAAGPITRIAVKSEPEGVAPGGTVTLNIQALDAEGRGASGHKLELVASAGTAAALIDKGGGNYSTTLTVPQGIAGEVKVSVVSPDGSVSGFLKVPVSGASAWANTAVAAGSTPADAGSGPEGMSAGSSAPDARVRQPRTPGSTPWLRTHAGFLGGQYSYQQKPLTSAGPLYNEQIQFGGNTTAPAGATGVSLGVRAWLPSMDWLGAEANFRSTYYSVEIPAFPDPVPDWVTDFQLLALARLPFDVGGSRMHLGARLGLGANDFVVYKLIEDNGPTLTYEPLIIPSLDLGAELGVDIGDKAFVTGSYTAGLANASALYNHELELSLGYNITNGLLLYGNTGLGVRSTDVWVVPTDPTFDRKKVGELSDGLTMFGIGLGYQR